MKAVLGLLLLVVPFVWFYVKHYSKKGYVRMQTAMILDKLYGELQVGNQKEAVSLALDILNLSAKDVDFLTYIRNLPLTHRNEVCFEFIEEVAKIAADKELEETPERMRDLLQ